MCYRFHLKAADVKKTAAKLGAKLKAEAQTRYNISPGVKIPVIKDTGAGREVENMLWGLHLRPEWAKEPGVSAATLANARFETAGQKQSFSEAFAQRHCVIPASGFFEWETLRDGKKHPWLFHAADGAPLLFAGLWDPAPLRAKLADDEEALPASCCILTGPPNSLLARLHDRMPVMLTPEEAEIWLNATAGRQDQAFLHALPAFPSEALHSHRCDPWMNKVGNDDIRGILPWEPPKPSVEQLGFGF